MTGFRSIWPTGAAVFASFLLYSAVRAPVPAVNEPHYLSKAKHYWSPDWCRGDLFLESANTHQFFYQTIGLLTTVFSLEATAWIGRVLAFALVASGWTALFVRIIPGRWSALWGAWVFLALQAAVNLSGEWLIGGVESKVLAYGFLFWGLATACDRRWLWMGALVGLAISMHPVVGIWGAGALAFGLVMMEGFGWGTDSRREPGLLAERAEPQKSTIDWARVAGSLGLLVVCSLPGLVPALAVLREGGSWAADYIVVFYRLAHHLDPKTFAPAAYAAYGGLLVAWLVGRQWAGLERRERLFAWFVVGATLIALAGLVIGWGPRPPTEMPYIATRIKLMKFYPFRLFDLMLPIAIAVTAAGMAARWERGVSNGLLRRMTIMGMGIALFAVALALPASDRNPSRLEPGRRADWIAASRWIAEHTPESSVILTPGESWAFKWFSHRPEFVSRKDCPQDAAGILEWNRRLRFLEEWGSRHYRPEQGYSAAAVRELVRETGVTHMLTNRSGPAELEPVYRNGTYRVYRLTEVMKGEAASDGV